MLGSRWWVSILGWVGLGFGDQFWVIIDHIVIHSNEPEKTFQLMCLSPQLNHFFVVFCFSRRSKRCFVYHGLGLAWTLPYSSWCGLAWFVAVPAAAASVIAFCKVNIKHAKCCCRPFATHKLHTYCWILLRGGGTHSCTLCKYLLCVDEADEQDTDDDGPTIDEATRGPLAEKIKASPGRMAGWVGGEWQKVLHK